MAKRKSKKERDFRERIKTLEMSKRKEV